MRIQLLLTLSLMLRNAIPDAKTEPRNSKLKPFIAPCKVRGLSGLWRGDTARPGVKVSDVRTRHLALAITPSETRGATPVGYALGVLALGARRFGLAALRCRIEALFAAFLRRGFGGAITPWVVLRRWCCRGGRRRGSRGWRCGGWLPRHTNIGKRVIPVCIGTACEHASQNRYGGDTVKHKHSR